MREGWEIKQLKDFTETINGLWTGKKEPYLPVNVYTMSNFSKESDLDHSKEPREVVASISQYEKRKLIYGDILIEKSGGGPNQPVGRAVLFDVKNNEDNTFSNFTTRLRITNENIDKIDSKYLHKYLKLQYLAGVTEKFQKNSTNIRNLQLKEYLELEIPIPPLHEQKRIVSILDRAFEAIDKAKANAEQNLKNAEEIFESYLQELFDNKGDDWEEYKLDEVCTITSKLIDPKEKKYQDFIHIGAGNIEAKKGTLIDLKTAKEENLISGKFLFDETMVLYSKIRPYLMKIVKCEFVGLCSADIYPLVPFKNKITQSFLYYLLYSKHFTEYAIKGSQRAGMPKVNRKHLFEYSFICPPVSEQEKIIEKLDLLSAETQELETIYQQKIKDLEELKKSILQKAFNGGL